MCTLRLSIDHNISGFRQMEQQCVCDVISEPDREKRQFSGGGVNYIGPPGGTVPIRKCIFQRCNRAMFSMGIKLIQYPYGH